MWSIYSKSAMRVMFGPNATDVDSLEGTRGPPCKRHINTSYEVWTFPLLQGQTTACLNPGSEQGCVVHEPGLPLATLR